MKQYIERELLENLKKWSDRPEIYAIKGPRQSGKTTLLRIFEDWLVSEKHIPPERVVFLNIEDKEVLEKFTKHPKEYIRSYLTSEKRHYFLFDEYHYVEEGGRKLKLLYDTFENVKFIITGSSSLELATKTSKFLVGRLFSFYLYPLSFHEFLGAKNRRFARIYKEKSMIVNGFIHEGKAIKEEEDLFGDDFQRLFEEFVTYGGYPEVVKTDDVETKRVIIKNIYDTYIESEIIDLLQIHDIFKFRTLVSVLSSQLGGMTNYNELASSCQSYYKKIMEYIETLEETFVIRTIRPYHRNVKTELRKNPKVYFIDLGLRNYAIDNFNGLEKRTDKGRIVENFVLNQLLRKEWNNLNYWRTLGKAEVDFVLTLKGETIPIEVKYSEFKKPRISRGFRSFISAYSPPRAIILTKNFFGHTQIGSTKVAFVPVYYI